jgi:hypothetical protein
MILPFSLFISDTEGICSVGGKFEAPKSCDMQTIYWKNGEGLGGFESGT